MFGKSRKEIHVIYHGVGEQKRRARRRFYAILIGACLLIAVVSAFLLHDGKMALGAITIAFFAALTYPVTTGKRT